MTLTRLLGKLPFNKKELSESISFDPETQIAVIRSSICTGEMVAGFKDKKTGHFTEVMMIRNEEEKHKFMKAYGLKEIKTEY